MIDIASDSLVYIAYLGFAMKRVMTYLHVLQQEDYDSGRLMKWVFEHSAYDKRLTPAFLVLGGASFYIPEFFVNFIIFICFVIATYIEKDPRKSSKKRLVATSRAKRVFFTALVPIALIGVPSFYLSHPWPWIFAVQMVLGSLLIAQMVLKPIEDIIQKMYWNEAAAKVRQLKPKIIGITGSFGKTSVKHILGHILRMHAPTLVTPGSVNTPMGITRIIREHLNESHRYLIVEMGAYGPGSIKRLCDLTPPDIGIITAIGHAHYERFKSLETVSVAKFELANAVLKKEGTAIIHERTLRFPYPRELRFSNEKNFIVCGEPQDPNPEKRKDVSYLTKDDLQIQKIQQNPNGLEVRITWKNTVYIIEAPLYGIHHGHNIAMAFVTALELGVEVEAIHTALRTMPQIEHRLEVKKMDDGTTLIDDAYNSNPVGFHSALDLLNLVKGKGRGILVTPGMVELGIAHDEVHAKVGEYAGKMCDIAVIINPERISTFVSAFKASSGGKTLVEVPSYAEASAWVDKNKQDGDVVLVENDLPDMYEVIPKM